MVDALAQILSAYHQLGQDVAAAEVIIGLGTNDPRVAERAAELYRQNMAPLLVFTGGISSWTAGLYSASEARAFARIAMEHGVPDDKILLEERAGNTGENIQFTRSLLEQRGRGPTRLLLVQKPYMERRTYATCKRVWPDADICVTSPRLHYFEYPLPWLSRDDIVHIMVGDLHRIHVYPRMGYQIAQEIPEPVRDAFHQLVQLGYTKHLVPGAAPTLNASDLMPT